MSGDISVVTLGDEEIWRERVETAGPTAGKVVFDRYGGGRAPEVLGLYRREAQAEASQKAALAKYPALPRRGYCPAEEDSVPEFHREVQITRAPAPLDETVAWVVLEGAGHSNAAAQFLAGGPDGPDGYSWTPLPPAVYFSAAAANEKASAEFLRLVNSDFEKHTDQRPWEFVLRVNKERTHNQSISNIHRDEKTDGLLQGGYIYESEEPVPVIVVEKHRIASLEVPDTIKEETNKRINENRGLFVSIFEE